MKRLIPVLLLFALFLCSCNRQEPDASSSGPTIEVIEPTWNPPNHIYEWQTWFYEDPDIVVPTIVRNEATGKTEVVGEDGKVIPEVTVNAKGSDLLTAIEAVGVNNSTLWWHNENSNRWLRGFWHKQTDVEAALNEIGLSLENIQPNCINRGENCIIMVLGSYEEKYQIIVEVYEDAEG